MTLEIKNEKTEKRMSFTLIESIAFWSGVVTVVATALAALSGSLSWYFSNKNLFRKRRRTIKIQNRIKNRIG